MDGLSENITLVSHHWLAQCLQLAKSLNVGSNSTVAFRDRHGHEFIKVDGFRYFPILIENEAFHFLVVLAAVGLVIFLFYIFALIFVLSRNFVDWDANRRRANALRQNREDGRAESIALAPPPPYSDSDLASPTTNCESFLFKRFLGECCYTLDGKFTVQAFEPKDLATSLGINLAIRPLKNKCRKLACNKSFCPDFHTFFVHIPCSHTAHPQLTILDPATLPGPEPNGNE